MDDYLLTRILATLVVLPTVFACLCGIVLTMREEPELKIKLLFASLGLGLFFFMILTVTMFWDIPLPS